MAHVPRWSEESELELANIYESYAKRMKQNGNTVLEVQRVLGCWEELANVANAVLETDLTPQQYKQKIEAWRVS